MRIKGSGRLRNEVRAERVRVGLGSSVVEQGTHKPLVVGSNPTRVTNVRFGRREAVEPFLR